MTAETAEATEAAAIAAGATELDNADPEAVLAWAFEHYGDDVTLACSFGGASGMVLMDMVQKLNAKSEVFYLDTKFLFPETLQTLETSRAFWPAARITGYSSAISVEAQAAEHGEALWERDPDLCCEIRKVEPNREALANSRAWISGLRRDQSEDRATTPAIQWDEKFGLVKINPLINWDEKRVWAYIAEHKLPYNPLHDQGFPSIGCSNCTRAVQPGEDPRAGRWAGTDKIECGIHVQ
ncbi:MAG TPA: phosphoadenylyl-sulfate reductase [Dehalococcoidia bacterium]|nr:phosphoadenylyl-sulfate reductase [Dehalococcoidia bacterium]